MKDKINLPEKTKNDKLKKLNSKKILQKKSKSNKSKSKKTKSKKTKSKKIESKKSQTKKKETKTDRKKYGIIVLDLDETLFHTPDGNENKVYWRPEVVNFLSFLHKYFYLVVFTRAVKSYADSILKKLKIKDGVVASDLFIIKLYRTCCTEEGKDMKKVIKKLISDKMQEKNNISKELLFQLKNNKPILNLDNIILIDNLPGNFLDTQFFNGIPIQDFYSNKKDIALQVLIKFFKDFLNKVSKNKTLTLRNFCYKNLCKINCILKIKYEKIN